MPNRLGICVKSSFDFGPLFLSIFAGNYKMHRLVSLVLFHMLSKALYLVFEFSAMSLKRTHNDDPT